MNIQGDYFEGYHKHLAGIEDDEYEVNQNFSYRNMSTINDYYALTNGLYYQYVSSGQYSQASEAMYAITIDENTTINKQGLSTLYYRQLKFDKNILLWYNKRKRMGVVLCC